MNNTGGTSTLVIIIAVAAIMMSIDNEPDCVSTNSRATVGGVTYQIELCTIQDGYKNIDGEEPLRILQGARRAANTSGELKRFLEKHPQERRRGPIFAFGKKGDHAVVEVALSGELVTIDTRTIGPDWYPPGSRFLAMRRGMTWW